MIVCICMNIDDRAILENKTFEEAQEKTRCSMGCGKCEQEVKAMILNQCRAIKEERDKQ